ncbi:MAG: DUF4292 domain-containing protein [Flavobacteriales bacterium]|nr:DUF4292 domain-containing protein [Flavobacteriales bacterium]
MLNKAYIPLLGLCFTLCMVGCKSNRATQTGGKDNLPNLKTAELVDSLRANDLHCDWMSIKYDVEIKTSKVDDSFKLYARIKQDSVIWISATYYAVEIARFLFTPDSVKYMDRRNNQFYIGGYDYLTNKFMIHADFGTLQSLITGNGASIIDHTAGKVRSAEGDGLYNLTFLNKGQMRRAMRLEEMRKPVELVVKIGLNPKTFRLSKASIMAVEDQRTLTATYSDYEDHCNSSYPKSIQFLAESANEQATVNTSVMKISTNKKVSVSFTIPEKYEALVP